MLDTFHMNMEEFDLPGAISRTGPRLVHFQANENNRGFVGSGHIDWPGILGRFRHAYDGPIVLEPFRRDDEKAGSLWPVAASRVTRIRNWRRALPTSRLPSLSQGGSDDIGENGLDRVRNSRQRDAAAAAHAA